jgi:hypothetical protein
MASAFTMSGDFTVGAHSSFPNLYGYGQLSVRGIIRSNVRTITATGTTLNSYDDVVLVNAGGATTTTLLSTAATGKTYTIKNIGAGAATVSAGSGTIDGAGTYSLGTQYDQAVFYHTGSNVWYVISE